MKWCFKSPLQNGQTFDWSDGTKSPFTYWKDEESAFLGDCAFADTNGRWHSTACESFLQGAICHVVTGRYDSLQLQEWVLCYYWMHDRAQQWLRTHVIKSLSSQEACSLSGLSYKDKYLSCQVCLEDEGLSRKECIVCSPDTALPTTVCGVVNNFLLLCFKKHPIYLEEDRRLPEGHVSVRRRNLQSG